MTLLEGDCLELMKQIPDGSVDMVLTDPPYSSGGMFAGDRKASTRVKYADCDFNGAARFPDFTGDTMDGHSYITFIRMTALSMLPKIKAGGIVAFFTDWRQLPSMADAIQTGGVIYRGIVVWNKKNSRPTPYRFRNDCEYVVWGTKGQRAAPMVAGATAYPGYYCVPSVSTLRKHHQTEKPVELLERLLEIVPKGATVLDAFMGSGSTGVACVNTGRDFIGIELDHGYFEVAKKRIEEAAARIGEVRAADGSV